MNTKTRPIYLTKTKYNPPNFDVQLTYVYEDFTKKKFRVHIFYKEKFVLFQL